MKSENRQNLKSNPDADNEIDYMDLHFPEDDDRNKTTIVNLPNNHVNKKNCKLYFFLFFLLLGIALVGILVYVLN